MSHKSDAFPANSHYLQVTTVSQRWTKERFPPLGVRSRSPVAVPVAPSVSAHPAGVRVGEADLGGGQLPLQPAPLLPLCDGHCLKKYKKVIKINITSIISVHSLQLICSVANLRRFS